VQEEGGYNGEEYGDEEGQQQFEENDPYYNEYDVDQVE
jgi:hypothetical protein